MKPLAKVTQRKKRYEYIQRYAEKQGYEITVIKMHLYKVTKDDRLIGYLRSWDRVHETILMDIAGEQTAACDEGSRKTRLV